MEELTSESKPGLDLSV